ncbi:hypothetical protein ASE00_00960 [Sphingomonas sp. Root710]|uniref:hypothetical protein n=1 Tax=Sphingomonas sp. Root710 TaxID=1736594 RepID=UPI0006FB3912|nr:hypothetical protein [Sphingomonas sp. Root710]KRB85403.1 hypothetical protein ASE00_00960 [Sphingomonas sp. Root710]
MAVGRVILAVACLAMAGGGQAAPGTNARLSLNLRTLDGAEVSYHPSRWLTIRRSFAFVRPDPVADAAAAPMPARARPRAYAMTGDIHPFGDGFRLSLGMREDANRRLLRSGNDRADISTGQYAPTISFGYAEEVGDGLSLGGDLGLLGKDVSGARDGVLVTPVEMASRGRDDDRGLKPVLRLSAGYRF